MREGILSEFFDRHVVLNENWLEAVLEFLNAQNAGPNGTSFSRWTELVFYQLLHSDLSQSLSAFSLSQSNFNPSAPKITFQTPLLLQLKSVRDIRQSEYSQNNPLAVKTEDDTGFDEFDEDDKEKGFNARGGYSEEESTDEGIEMPGEAENMYLFEDFSAINSKLLNNNSNSTQINSNIFDAQEFKVHEYFQYSFLFSPPEIVPASPDSMLEDIDEELQQQMDYSDVDEHIPDDADASSSAQVSHSRNRLPLHEIPSQPTVCDFRSSAPSLPFRSQSSSSSVPQPPISAPFPSTIVRNVQQQQNTIVQSSEITNNSESAEVRKRMTMVKLEKSTSGPSSSGNAHSPIQLDDLSPMSSNSNTSKKKVKIEIVELDESDGSIEKQKRDVPIPECSQSSGSCSSQFGNLTDLRRHIGTANEPFKMLVQAHVADIIKPLTIRKGNWYQQVSLLDSSTTDAIACDLHGDLLEELIGFTPKEAVAIRRSSDSEKRAEGERKLKALETKMRKPVLLIQSYLSACPMPVLQSLPIPCTVEVRDFMHSSLHKSDFLHPGNFVEGCYATKHIVCCRDIHTSMPKKSNRLRISKLQVHCICAILTFNSLEYFYHHHPPPIMTLPPYSFDSGIFGISVCSPPPHSNLYLAGQLFPPLALPSPAVPFPFPLLFSIPFSFSFCCANIVH
ncbi:hypothetical protein WR25_13859 [Diploscapter pachys]|uniref:RMI1 N-terminal domain-containing protein n=1 Tax=Diploscapter pachys TaxID=2018661 RepID=A0A2A2LUI5_9BILA|nr:hypothetical protein WR25_13859 [Diploscapter pachys]